MKKTTCTKLFYSMFCTLTHLTWKSLSEVSVGMYGSLCLLSDSRDISLFYFTLKMLPFDFLRWSVDYFALRCFEGFHLRRPYSVIDFIANCKSGIFEKQISRRRNKYKYVVLKLYSLKFSSSFSSELFLFLSNIVHLSTCVFHSEFLLQRTPFPFFSPLCNVLCVTEHSMDLIKY